jgi:hypothetical protein
LYGQKKMLTLKSSRLKFATFHSIPFLKGPFFK